MTRFEIKKLVKKIMIKEGLLDFFKMKKRQTWEEWKKENLYTDVNKWADDFLDDYNRYRGCKWDGSLWYAGFPLSKGDYIPSVNIKYAMKEWNAARWIMETQPYTKIIPRDTRNIGWLKEPPI